jgi:hypothetical protein
VLHVHSNWLVQLDRYLLEPRLADADTIAGNSEYVTPAHGIVQTMIPRVASNKMQSEDEAELIVMSRRLATLNGEEAEILVRYNATPLSTILPPFVDRPCLVGTG